MDKVQAAVARFQEGCSCSQAMLATYGQQFGIDEPTALRLAAGFGGAMGRLGDTCGAITGAYMVLGLRHGGPTAQDVQAKEQTYRMVREFARRFKDRNGSLACRDLLGCDISTPEGLERAKQQKLIATVCPKMVQAAAEILEELLGQSKSGAK